jgi:hypothetical protein
MQECCVSRNTLALVDRRSNPSANLSEGREKLNLTDVSTADDG